MKRLQALLLILAILLCHPPAKAAPYCEPNGGNADHLVGCNLSIASISEVGSVYYPNNGGSQGYLFDEVDLMWIPNYPPPIPRGRGTLIQVLPTINQICFDEPSGPPVLPLTLPYGNPMLISCQSNVPAKIEDMVGRSPVNGTVVAQHLSGQWSTIFEPYIPWPAPATNYAIFMYSNHVWTPTEPVAKPGEALWIQEPTAFVYEPLAFNPRVVSDTFSFDVETVYGKSVMVEFTETWPVPDWQELTTFTGDGHPKTVVDANNPQLATQRYYRIKTSVP